MKKILTLLFILATYTAFSQITVVNADSLRLGTVSGVGGAALYGRTFLKNLTYGGPSDSLLVTDSSGKIKFIKRSDLQQIPQGLNFIKNYYGDIPQPANFNISGVGAAESLRFGSGALNLDIGGFNNTLYGGTLIRASGSLRVESGDNADIHLQSGSAGTANNGTWTLRNHSSIGTAPFRILKDENLQLELYGNQLYDGNGVRYLKEGGASSGNFIQASPAVAQSARIRLTGSDTPIIADNGISLGTNDASVVKLTTSGLNFEYTTAAGNQNSEFYLRNTGRITVPDYFIFTTGGRASMLIGSNSHLLNFKTAIGTNLDFSSYTPRATLDVVGEAAVKDNLILYGNANIHFLKENADNPALIDFGHSAIIDTFNGLDFRVFNNNNTDRPDYSKGFKFRNKGFMYMEMNSTPSIPGVGSSSLAYNTINTYAKFFLKEQPELDSNPTQLLTRDAAGEIKYIQVSSSALRGSETRQFLAKGSGNGSTMIRLQHGLSGISVSNSVVLTANNAAAGGINYVTLDVEYINIFYAVPPPMGTENLTYSISIK